MAVTKPKPQSSEMQEILRLVDKAQVAGRPDGYGGKRRCTRFAAGMRLEYLIQPARGGGMNQATMQNVSEGGFAFWSKRHLVQHTQLVIREFSEDGQNDWVAATVRHCTRGLRGFLVGVEFDNPPIED